MLLLNIVSKKLIIYDFRFPELNKYSDVLRVRRFHTEEIAKRQIVRPFVRPEFESSF